MIEDGTTVSIEYTLKLDDGSTADSNVGGQPLTYQHGSQQILPAVEREVAGMQVDESRQFVLSPEDGYGVVQTELHQQVEVDVVPEDGRHVGAQLVSEDPNGNRTLVRVHEVHEDRIVLDMNHPLAGQNLHFEVKLLSIG